MKEFVDIPDMEPEQLIETFENLGHEVEDWRTVESGFTGVVVGKVLEVAPHPNADKVRLTKVDVGDRESSRSSAVPGTSKPVPSCRLPCPDPCSEGTSRSPAGRSGASRRTG